MARRLRRVAAGVLAGLVALAVAGGTFERLWYLFHQSIGADDATVGLMARQIVHGHFSAFFWAQDYGGAEAYPVALGFLVFGSSAWVLKVTPVVLFALSAVLTGFVCFRLTRSRTAALVAGAAVWIWPESSVWDSTRELGFRNLTLCCGLGCLLLALQLVERGRTMGAGRRALRFGALGLLAGVGWWSSPEVGYFLVASSLVLGAAAIRPVSGLRLRATELATAVAGAAVGALPWIWGSVNDGFRSLDLSTNSGGPPSSYLGRLGGFFTHTLPLLWSLRLPVMVGWRRTDDLAWLASGLLGKLLYAAMLAAVLAGLALAWRKGGSARAVAVSVLVFPFLYALSASTSGGTDGRFGIYLAPLLVSAVVAGVAGRATGAAGAGSDRPSRVATRPWPSPIGRPAVLSLLLVAVAGTSLASFAEIDSASVAAVPGAFAGWRDPNASLTGLVTRLRALQVRVVAADYWEAGDLAFVGRGNPATVSFDLVRDGRANASALRRGLRGDMAWLCYPPSRLQRAAATFGATTPGPAGDSEQTLEAAFRRIGVGYRVHHLGLLDAVVPDRPVAPRALGIPAWLYTLPPATSWTTWSTEHTTPAR